MSVSWPWKYSTKTVILTKERNFRSITDAEILILLSDHSIHNAIIGGKFGINETFHTYFPFNDSPNQFETLTLHGSSSELFPSKIENLHQNAIYICMLYQYPFTHFGVHGNAFKIYGHASAFLGAMQKFNATLIGAEAFNSANISVFYMNIGLETFNYFETAYSFMTLTFKIAVRYDKNFIDIKSVLFENVIGSSWVTVLIILVTFVLASFLTWPNQSPVQSALGILQIILLSFPEFQIKSSPLKIILTAFSAFCLIYMTAIQTLLVTNLIEPPIPYRMKSIQEFIDREYTCGAATPQIFEWFSDEMKGLKTRIFPEDYFMHNSPASIDTEGFIFNEHEFLKFGEALNQNFYLLPKTIVQFYYSLICTRNSPFCAVMDDINFRLFESGIFKATEAPLEVLFNFHRPKIANITNHYSIITFEKLFFVWWLLGFGCVLSLGVFVIELLCQYPWNW